MKNIVSNYLKTTVLGIINMKYSFGQMACNECRLNSDVSKVSSVYIKVNTFFTVCRNFLSMFIYNFK
jgi:hypothetical protein